MTIDYSEFTVIQLKAKLSERGLPTTGKKDELIKRLVENDTLNAKTNITAETIESKEAPVESPKAVEKVTTEVIKPISPTVVKEQAANEEDLKKKRAERFGIEMTLEERKKMRKDRFEKKSILSPEEEEKLRQRRERFGLISPSLKKQEDLERKKQRAERFGPK